MTHTPEQVRQQGAGHDPLTNPLCRRLGIRWPVYGLAHSIEVAAAISNAGGLGVYAAARDGPDELAGKLRDLRRLCPDRPVGVDLLLPTALPGAVDADTVAAAVPEGHKAFIDTLFARFAVPPATQGNFFSQYVRSQALFEEQVEAVAQSDIEVFAAGVGTPVRHAGARAQGRQDHYGAGRLGAACAEGHRGRRRYPGGTGL